MTERVMFRVVSTGAPRRVSIQLKDALHSRRPDWDVDYHWYKGSLCPYPDIFREAEQKGMDYCITTCDDLGLPEDELEQVELWSKYDYPVIDALVPIWNTRGVYWNNYHMTPEGVVFSVNPGQMATHEQVYFSSLAMTCYREDVFRHPELRHAWNVKVDEADQLVQFGGADVQFCLKLQELDIPHYSNKEVMVEHLRILPLRELVRTMQSWARSIVENKSVDVEYGLPTAVRYDAGHLLDSLPMGESYRAKWCDGTYSANTTGRHIRLGETHEHADVVHQHAQPGPNGTNHRVRQLDPERV